MLRKAYINKSENSHTRGEVVGKEDLDSSQILGHGTRSDRTGYPTVEL